jgi:geranylgeranyl transferase type-1 subunit beta
MESVDSNRMTLVFFAISGLDLLGTLDAKLTPERKAEIIDWIYALQVVVPRHPAGAAGGGGGRGGGRGDGEAAAGQPQQHAVPSGFKAGFRGAPFMGCKHDPGGNPQCSIAYDGGHLAMSYTALATLTVLGDDFSRVRRRDMATALRAYQQADGSFMCAEDGEVDMRFTYCACCTFYPPPPLFPPRLSLVPPPPLSHTHTLSLSPFPLTCMFAFFFDEPVDCVGGGAPIACLLLL